VRVRIRSPKDFWAGLMFIAFGVFAAIWAYANYQMGTAVRMGPAYFPTVLGGLLAFLGVLVLIEAFALEDRHELHVPFNIVDLAAAIAIFAVLIYLSPRVGLTTDYGVLAATLVVSVLTVLYRPNAKALVLISAACVVYGYVMKPLGLVIATAFLVFISAFGGHEFKWREVGILYVILIIFSILVFVKGLTLPFPLWPAVLGY
jgi:Tripartite tricarboxylate transporter TctB family